MAERRIVVCPDQQSANTQMQVLLQQHFQASLPQQMTLVQWDATAAGGTGDIVPNCWIVVGDK
jgi:hypothetical protein